MARKQASRRAGVAIMIIGIVAGAALILTPLLSSLDFTTPDGQGDIPEDDYTGDDTTGDDATTGTIPETTGDVPEPDPLSNLVELSIASTPLSTLGSALQSAYYSPVRFRLPGDFLYVDARKRDSTSMYVIFHANSYPFVQAFAAAGLTLKPGDVYFFDDLVVRAAWVNINLFGIPGDTLVGSATQRIDTVIFFPKSGDSVYIYAAYTFSVGIARGYMFNPEYYHVSVAA